QNSTGMTDAGLGEDQVFYPVGEGDKRDAIATVGSGKGQKTGSLKKEVAFGSGKGSREVDKEGEAATPLFPVLADMRHAGAGGDVPVDGPDIIPGLIRTQFGELHP